MAQVNWTPPKGVKRVTDEELEAEKASAWTPPPGVSPATNEEVASAPEPSKSYGTKSAEAFKAGVKNLPSVGEFILKDFIPGVAETAVSMGTGLAGTIAGGAEGLATANQNRYAKQFVPEEALNDPAEIRRKRIEQMTYQPRTATGQRAVEVAGTLSAPFNWAGRQFGDAVQSLTGSEVVGDVSSDIAAAALTGATGKALGSGARTTERFARKNAPTIKELAKMVPAGAAGGVVAELIAPGSSLAGALIGPTLQKGAQWGVKKLIDKPPESAPPVSSTPSRVSKPKPKYVAPVESVPTASATPTTVAQAIVPSEQATFNALRNPQGGFRTPEVDKTVASANAKTAQMNARGLEPGLEPYMFGGKTYMDYRAAGGQLPKAEFDMIKSEFSPAKSDMGNRPPRIQERAANTELIQSMGVPKEHMSFFRPYTNVRGEGALPTYAQYVKTYGKNAIPQNKFNSIQKTILDQYTPD